MIVFNDTLGAYGGSHTLLCRMCEWLTSHGIRTAILCDNANNDEIASALKEAGVEIYPIDVRKTGALVKMLKQFHEEITVCNFDWNHYLDIEAAKARGHLQFNNFIYCIHPNTFKKGIGFKTKFMRRFAKNASRKQFLNMVRNHAVVMMDEIDLDRTEDFFGITTDPKPPILRLPMTIGELENARELIRESYEKKIILTASRAEIPFKGYLLGLIDDFADLKADFPNLRLVIVSSGHDVGMITDRINAQSEEVKQAIELRSWIPYKQLSACLMESYVYIGMGTTILDAAKLYKPAIPVKIYTEENIAESFFAEKPEYLSADEKCSEKAVSLLRKALSSSLREYESLSFASFNAAKRLYDIDQIMDKFISIKTDRYACIISGRERLLHKMNNLLNKLRYRNKNLFDWREVKQQDQ